KEYGSVEAVVRNGKVYHTAMQALGDLAGKYPTPEEVARAHNIDNLPPADNRVVAILDSGSPSWNPGYVSKEISVVEGEPARDEYGHGGAVIDIVHTVAPEAKIASVRVLGDKGMGRLDDILRGVYRAVHMEPMPDVIGMSLGARPNLRYPALARSCMKMERFYDVEIIASAGNTGTGTGRQTSPAYADPVLSIGAVNSDMDLAFYSARYFDIAAVGTMTVEWLGRSLEAKGTSFSQPVVSAAAVRYMNRYRIRPARLDDVETVSSSALVMAESLPVLDGGKLSRTEPIREPTEWDVAGVYFALAMVGLGIIVMGVTVHKWRKM
ncbi:MAG: S8 family serine peptidase, partial [Candidatus Nanohaloarchaea archaeon]|nr:S8 family serine peptidase [Candidatus Nanohaloarchaea archaeon]